jgi:hypothetical protein
MATSEVSICNLALQKLGAARIVSLTENSRNAKSVNACYESQRDTELRKYLWNFAKKRASLAASSVAPISMYEAAYPVPSDFLRLIKPARLGLDWHLEQHEGGLAILSNDGAPLEIRYLAKVTNPVLFDPAFVEMLACKIAWHVCEDITQSNTKKAALMEEYREHKAEARRTNAFEVAHTPEPLDEWLVARQTGQLVNTEWDEE